MPFRKKTVSINRFVFRGSSSEGRQALEPFLYSNHEYQSRVNLHTWGIRGTGLFNLCQRLLELKTLTYAVILITVLKLIENDI